MHIKDLGSVRHSIAFYYCCYYQNILIVVIEVKCFLNFIYLFSFACAASCCCARGLSLTAACSSYYAHKPTVWLLLLWDMGSRVVGSVGSN